MGRIDWLVLVMPIDDQGRALHCDIRSSWIVELSTIRCDVMRFGWWEHCLVLEMDGRVLTRLETRAARVRLCTVFEWEGGYRSGVPERKGRKAVSSPQRLKDWKWKKYEI